MVENKVYRNSVIYTFCNFLLRSMGFLLLPIYTAFLTTSDYGITGLMDRFVAVASVLSTFSMQSGVMRFYIDYRDDSEGLARFTGTVVCFAFLSTISFDLAFYILRGFFVPVLFSGVDYWPYIAVTLTGMAFTNIYGIYQQVLRGMERARESAITSIIYLMINVILTMFFVVGLRLGAIGVIVATALSGLSLSIWALISMYRARAFHPCLDRSILREMLRYTIPLMPHNLSTQIASLVSGVLINLGGSLGAVGLYNVANKFGSACDTLQSSVSTAYSPWLYRMLEDRPEGYKMQLVDFTNTLLDVYVLVFVGVSYFVREPILLLLDSSYAESWTLVPMIALVYAAKSAYYFYIGVLFYHKEATNRIFVATLTSSLLNVALSFPFVAWWGSYGSVVADGISMIVRVAIIVEMASKFEDVGYRLSMFVSSFLLVALFVVVGLAPCAAAPFSIVWWTMVWRIALYGLLASYVLRRHPRVLEVVRGKISRGN